MKTAGQSQGNSHFFSNDTEHPSGTSRAPRVEITRRPRPASRSPIKRNRRRAVGWRNGIFTKERSNCTVNAPRSAPLVVAPYRHNSHRFIVEIFRPPLSILAFSTEKRDSEKARGFTRDSCSC